MELTAQIGPLRFHYVTAVAAYLPPIDGVYALSIDDDPVVSATAEGRLYLAMDHRQKPSPDCPAFIELWRPTGATDTNLGALFLICESETPTAIRPSDLRELEGVLNAAADDRSRTDAVSLSIISL